MRREIRTTSGSTYVLDEEALTIARVQGSGAPTARVGEGARRYLAVTGPDLVSPPAVGAPMLIWWGEHAAVPAVAGAEPATVTTPIASIRALEAA